MTKTVKQIVDEYLAKQNRQNIDFDYIVVIKMNGCNSVETKRYYNVSDITQSNEDKILLYGYQLNQIQFTHTIDNINHRVNIIGQIIERSFIEE